MNNDGWVKLHRKIQKSEIWGKPSDWLKIWIYILQEVNHTDNKLFNRGENLFNYIDIARECGVKYNSVAKFIKWAKLATLLATQKTTRGVIIKALKYNEYQASEKIKGDTKGDTCGEIEAKSKRNRSDTIIEEYKNERMKENTTNVVLANTPEPEKVEYGNSEINAMLLAMKGKIGIEEFADNQKWARIYAKHCVNLMGKIGPDEFSRRLESILSDQFKRKRCNEIKYVYEQVKGFIEPSLSINSY